MLRRAAVRCLGVVRSGTPGWGRPPCGRARHRAAPLRQPCAAPLPIVRSRPCSALLWDRSCPDSKHAAYRRLLVGADAAIRYAMAILQAIFSLLSRSAGKLVNAVFGWAVRALFGQPKPSEQTL